MDKIYKDSESRFVSSTIVYADIAGSSGGGRACKDPECTIEMTAEELKKAYDDGCVIYPKGSPIDGSTGSWNPVWCRKQISHIQLGIVFGENASMVIKKVTSA